MFAGHYNNKTCYGDTIEKFKIIAEETSKFLETAEANYDVAVTNAKVSGSDRILTKREVEAKKFLLHAKMQKCLMLKEIYKKYGVDLYDDDSAFAFLFFLMAIQEQERRKLAAKRHVYYLEQKAKRALYKIQCIKELTVDDSSENEFNLNNTSFCSCIPNKTIYPVKRKISKTDKEFGEFEEVFSGSRFYINKKTKKLWLLADEVLIPVQAEDYIKKENKKMCWSGEKGVSGACSQYGKSYGKLKICAECGVANYCKDSTAIEKVHVDYTIRDNFSEVENIAQYAKASNVSGQVIANLLQLTDFNLVKFYVVICRLGNLTYKEIANFLGISDVQVFKYCESLSPEIKKLFKHKACTMLEIEEAFKKFKQPEQQKKYFERTFKKLVQLEFNFQELDKVN